MTFFFTDGVTEKQLVLLRDLWIHIANSIPSQRVETAWAKLTVTEARDLIRDYYTKLEHFDAYEGPEEGTPEYDALSANGKAFIYEGADPYFNGGPTRGY